MVALTRITGSIVSVRAMATLLAATACAGVVAELVAPTLLALAASGVVFLGALAVGARWADPAAFDELRRALRRRTARGAVAARRPTSDIPPA
jgi:hypothetical protein